MEIIIPEGLAKIRCRCFEGANKCRWLRIERRKLVCVKGSGAKPHPSEPEHCKGPPDFTVLCT